MFLGRDTGGIYMGEVTAEVIKAKIKDVVKCMVMVVAES
jgi:hypothetical protein